MSLNRILALLLLSWIPVTAQEPVEAEPAPVEPAAEPAGEPAPGPGAVPPPPGVPVPGANQAPAGAPNNRQPVLPGLPNLAQRPIDPAVLAQTKIVEDIVEPKLSGTALAGLYRKYTGRRVIVSAAASTAEFSFVQDASPQDPLTYAQAAELLRKAAIIEQFVFVPHPQDPELDILTLATGGIRPPGIGLDIYNENSELPDTDAVITYVMNLDYIKPAEAVNTFTQIIGQFGAFGSIAAVPNASAVVITENASLIRKLIDLKKEIDKPGSVQATRFIKVQYADVTEIATVLTELLTAQQSSQQTAGIQRADAPAAPAGAPAAPGGAPAGGADGGGGGEATPVQIVPEPRTNRIFAMGRPVDLIFVEGLVREFDIPSGEKNFLRRKLKFLTVSEFLPIAGDAITRAFSGTGDSGGSGGTSGTSGRSSSQGSRTSSSSQSNRNTSSGFGNSSSMGSNSFGSGGFGSSSGGFGSSSGGRSGSGASLSDPSINSAPESMLVGRTLLVADNITNSIVAQGPPPALEIIERLLDQIDVKSDQVMISTVFGQLSLGDTMQTGVDWLKLFNEHGDGSGVAGSIFTGLRNSVFDPSDLTEFSNSTSSTDTDGNVTTTAGFPTSTGLSLYGKIGSDVAAYVSLLQTDSNFTVLSRPSVFTSNNRRGSISSGRRIPVPTNSNSFSAGGVSTNIEYRDVVLKLEVIPLVNSPQEITLEIALVSDDVVGQSDEIEGLGRVPIIGTREILTTVTVPNNQTVVLGGLISESDRRTSTGIPILSSIPGLGRLFSQKTDNTERDELLVFIQPSIVSSDPRLEELQVDLDNRYNVSTPARAFADPAPPQGVLPAPGEIPQPAAAPSTTPSGSNLKPSLRPIHRR